MQLATSTYRIPLGMSQGADMDAGSVLGFMAGYVATLAGVFLLYLPVLALFVALLVAAGVVQLLLLPFIILFRRLRRPGNERDADGSWILGR
ncbi:hypothetical protein [Pseudarthrobacter phenanthrenivorans]|uniref:hypothetical protein n=1 Tax=Pseudarthrobacter phenanthrenivorans TaxID=361575 RepID=UPI002F35C52F